ALSVDRVQRGDARKIAALLAYRREHAKANVIHFRGIEIVAVAEGFEHLRGQLQRGLLMQRAVLLAFAARRAHRVIDIGLSHSLHPSSRRHAPQPPWRGPESSRGAMLAPTPLTAHAGPAQARQN